MGLLKKKNDPISDRTRALGAEIAALEAEIKQLTTKNEAQAAAQPRVRSTAVPGGHTKPASHSPVSSEPIFEPLDRLRRQSATEAETTSAHFNELGVRKYDLLGAWKRLQNHLRGTSAANPKLVSYLAAGSIKGLRPLRYEKRVARNRFIALSIFFLFVLWGILALIFSHR
ncbi:MAG: hypothetical protein JWM99_1090 [Verrucomicrobiales bacterium]|nr:hypothetical protein [Verrucomicrobiales bacterium]